MSNVLRIAEFDTWRPGYAGASVKVLQAGTSTLALIFFDEALTLAAPNPQGLASTTDANNQSYGKFAAPIYVGGPYTLSINSIDTTGVVRPPLTTLAGQDASQAVVTPTGGAGAPKLADIVARRVDIRNFGVLDPATAAANTVILANAIGAAAALGGGRVLIQPGTWPFTTLQLPANVILEGYGRGVTTLTSQNAGNVITLAGDRAGLERITLDGVNLIATSVGIYGINRAEVVFRDAEIKRFDTCLWLKGGHRNSWKDLYLSGGNINAKLHGDTDVGTTNLGDVYRNNEWIGGKVELANTDGLQLFYKDKRCSHFVVRDVGFENSPGMALRINGARFGTFEGCWWIGNGGHIDIHDDANSGNAARVDNTCLDITFRRGMVGPAPGLTNAGTIAIAGLAQNIVFEQMELDGVAITLNSPSNSIQVRDCVEDSFVTLAGDGTKWIRRRSQNMGASFGVTSDATLTPAWRETLAPGQVVMVEATIVAKQRNGINTAEYWVAASAKRPGSTMLYDTRTATFNLGTVITGQASGATARITADTNGVGTGTLTLTDIKGVFTIGEIITDSSGGSGRCAGAQVDQAAVLLGAVLPIRAARTDDAAWVVNIDVAGGDVRVTVTGKAATTIEWTVDVYLVTT